MQGPRATRPRRPRPRLGPQHAAAGSAKSHANATCGLPSDRAVDAKAPAPYWPSLCCSGPCLTAGSAHQRLHTHNTF